MPRWSIPRKRCVRGNGTLPTTKPVKKKLTQPAVSMFGTMKLRFFVSMLVIMVGSDSICAWGFAFFAVWLNTPVSCD